MLKWYKKAGPDRSADLGAAPNSRVYFAGNIYFMTFLQEMLSWLRRGTRQWRRLEKIAEYH